MLINIQYCDKAWIAAHNELICHHESHWKKKQVTGLHIFECEGYMAAFTYLIITEHNFYWEKQWPQKYLDTLSSTIFLYYIKKKKIYIYTITFIFLHLL